MEQEQSERRLLLPDLPGDSHHDEDEDRGEPDRPATSHRVTKLTTGCILFTELGERLTFYSIAANQVPFCKEVLGYTNVAALSINLAFSGACYVVPIIGGWVADTVSGRYNAIFGSALIYLLGVFLLPVIGHDFNGSGLNFSEEAKRGFFFLAIMFIAAGTGGIKSNVAPFGAQQVEEHGLAAVNSFFNWFYWFINMGTLGSFTVVAYVQQTYGYDYGYAIPAFVLLLSVIIFIIPRKRYISTNTRENMLSKLYRVLYDSVRLRWRSNERYSSLFDYAREKHGGAHSDELVNQIQAVFGTLPVLTCLILYWLVNQQCAGQYILQAMGMNLRLGSSFTIPAASLNIFDALTIMILVPIVDRLVYPRLEKINRKPTLLQRIGLGMVFTLMALVISIVVEIERKKEISQSGGFVQNVTGTSYNASHISVLWQTPQFCCLGAGEVFTSISGLDFSYTETPRQMQGLMMGMYLLTIGLGGFIGSALTSLVNKATEPNVWIPDDINNGHVEYYYALTAALLLINFFVFLLVAKKYRYKRLGVEDEGVVGGDDEPPDS